VLIPACQSFWSMMRSTTAILCVMPFESSGSTRFKFLMSGVLWRFYMAAIRWEEPNYWALISI